MDIDTPTRSKANLTEIGNTDIVRRLDCSGTSQDLDRVSLASSKGIKLGVGRGGRQQASRRSSQL